MGYIWQTLWDIFIKICNKLGKSYGIYWAKTIGYFMRYIRQKLGDILGKIAGYIGKKLGNILWVMVVKSHGIYLKNKGYIG